MDAIKPGFWSDSEPINLISDALNRGERAHMEDVQVKYLPRGRRRDSLSVVAPRRPTVNWHRRSRVRTRIPPGTRKSIAQVLLAKR